MFSRNQVAEALRQGKYSDLAIAVRSARLEMAQCDQLDNECSSVCQSILLHTERFLLKCAAAERSHDDSSAGLDSDRCFFEVWYSLGAFGLGGEPRTLSRG